MIQKTAFVPRTYRALGRQDLDDLPQLRRLGRERILAMKAVAAVFPFRVNNYILDELIDWSRVPEDPIFQLTFPQPGMLEGEQRGRMLALVRAERPKDEIEAAAREIQLQLNPHPAGQLELNVPRQGGEVLPGIQHKYRETVLFFPSQGQTCHAYCAYCFRWAQFVGIDELKFANREAESLVRYLEAHEEVSDVLFTGGDPLIMKTSALRRYVEPLLRLESVRNIRIGTKALSYWPYRFLTDPDADDLLRLFEEVGAAGKQLALMGHYSHPVELETSAAREALRRVLRTGAVIRSQAPVIRHVNDCAEAWAEMWQIQVRYGVVPYYMFVERDTGPKHYFEVPLARALEIFQGAFRRQSGLGRTVRGPSMSANPGKILVDGVTEIRGRPYFVLKCMQGRDPEWAGRVFFAEYDPEAAWIEDLQPAFGEQEFFFEEPLRHIERMGPPWRASQRERESRQALA